MVNKTSIDAALRLLRAKGDPVSLAQAEVLADRLNERSVFDKYVVHVSEAERDETLYYACRDAARFLQGGLTLEELIPDASKVEVDVPANDDHPETKTQACPCTVAVLTANVQSGGLCDAKRGRPYVGYWQTEHAGLRRPWRDKSLAIRQVRGLPPSGHRKTKRTKN